MAFPSYLAERLGAMPRDTTPAFWSQDFVGVLGMVIELHIGIHGDVKKHLYGLSFMGGWCFAAVLG